MQNYGTNARYTDGRFGTGNTFGTGRPRREVERAYLTALRKCVPLADWRKIVKRAVADAKLGDAKARQWLADYVLGKPKEAAEILDANDAANEPAKVILVDWRTKTLTKTNGENHELPHSG